MMDIQLESYKKLKNLLQQFTETFSPHLDETSISRLGVELSKFDLHHETGNEDVYFLPMTQTRVKAMKERPDIDLEFMPCERCCITDAEEVDKAISSQFFRAQDEGSDLLAHELSPWRLRRLTGRYERRLFEFVFWDGDAKPTRRTEWHLAGVMEADGYPHQICFSCHQVDNVNGLVRSEMMILTSLMIAKMRRATRDSLHETYPVLMVSVIGRYARIIQGHMWPVQRHLKVRYSQLFHFDPCTQETMDLFLSWLLSTPLTTNNKEPDTQTSFDEETSSDSGSDIVSQEKARARASSPCKKRKPPYAGTRCRFTKLAVVFRRLCCMSRE